MGCVHGRPATSSPVAVSASRRRDHPSTAAAVSQPQQEGVASSAAPAEAAPEQAAGEKAEKPAQVKRERRSRSSRSAAAAAHAEVRLGGSFANKARGEQVAAGWPAWLSAVAGEAIDGWTPRRADSFEKIDKVRLLLLLLIFPCFVIHAARAPRRKIESFFFLLSTPSLSQIGQGTYSNVYKARDSLSGKIVALKKVRFDNLEPESVRFMAREILILRRLDHPNVVKLDGLVTSRMSCSLYLVFDYMVHDLAGLAASPDIKFTLPQVKCYVHQLLSGLEHCHNRGVLHRDIKGSNLLLDNNGVLKIADFGLASFFDPNHKQPMTSRVVTLWYRPPELLLGATDYGVGVDLWSAGCILAELLAGKPIMPGRTEFFTTEPYACDPSSLPQYPPSKEMDAKRRDEEARRLRAAAGRANGDATRKTRTRDRPRAAPAPEANAEIQANIDKRRLITHANAKSKSEKFPPPHQDGALGFPLGCSNHIEPTFEPPDPSSFSTVFPYEKGAVPTWSGPLVDSATGNQKRKHKSGRSSKQPSTARAR
ncbi:hypothetical protein PR202_gb21945 [Eleusine coracana subsp. coracana]|uniref:[RNA-polymerase]-subunit kinase n=1 Tax=Eleusine coracana subsp. coracana TaxID=191504 RepID=A0AAV5FFB6_ELECO|nr:hypothetical protein PR202_gb21945 [Eleusine coracana subsp. coracana]